MDFLGLRWRTRAFLERRKRNRARRNAKRFTASLLSKELRRPMDYEALKNLGLPRTLQYAYLDYYFAHFLPPALRTHRDYFSENVRGFGEDAFHAMWFLLFQAFRPASALEIGVYRGQTITLWKLLTRELGFDCEVACVSPFSSAGDSVSNYSKRIDYYEDVVVNHSHFDLPMPACCKAFSNSPEAVDFIKQRKWDVIYIDGNHEYEVAKQDWQLCSEAVAPGGIIVMDDSSLNTDFTPPPLSKAGHPGPSRVAQEIDPACFEEILSAGHNRVFRRIA